MKCQFKVTLYKNSFSCRNYIGLLGSNLTLPTIKLEIKLNLLTRSSQNKEKINNNNLFNVYFNNLIFVRITQSNFNF